MQLTAGHKPVSGCELTTMRPVRYDTFGPLTYETRILGVRFWPLRTWRPDEVLLVGSKGGCVLKHLRKLGGVSSFFTSMYFVHCLIISVLIANRFPCYFWLRRLMNIYNWIVICSRHRNDGFVHVCVEVTGTLLYVIYWRIRVSVHRRIC
jgi:hypothetical protein